MLFRSGEVMERREFIKICAAGAAMAAGNTFALTNTEPRFYSRTPLVDYDGRPLKTSRLQVKQNYIFHYPFLVTPCFLLNLGKPGRGDTAHRRWQKLPQERRGGRKPFRCSLFRNMRTPSCLSNQADQLYQLSRQHQLKYREGRCDSDRKSVV